MYVCMLRPSVKKIKGKLQCIFFLVTNLVQIKSILATLKINPTAVQLLWSFSLKIAVAFH